MADSSIIFELNLLEGEITINWKSNRLITLGDVKEIIAFLKMYVEDTEKMVAATAQSQTSPSTHPPA